MKNIDKRYFIFTANIEKQYKLSKKDILRLEKFIDGNIFSKKCAIWKGYLHNCRGPKVKLENINKRRYINFWHNKKRTKLHRLLYRNYKGPIPNGFYIRFICKTSLCCNVEHLKLRKYNIKKNNIIINKPKKQAKKLLIIFD